MALSPSPKTVRAAQLKELRRVHRWFEASGYHVGHIDNLDLRTHKWKLAGLRWKLPYMSANFSYLNVQRASNGETALVWVWDPMPAGAVS